MAAARNVSAATRSTFFPADWYCAASLAIVVVLPTPFTPRKMITHGRTDSGTVFEVVVDAWNNSTIACCKREDISCARSSAPLGDWRRRRSINFSVALG